MQSLNRYSILIIGPFSFTNPEEREVIRNFPGKINNTMPEAAVSVSIPMEKRICKAGYLTLSFTRPADFSVASIIKKHPWLFHLKSAVDYISSAMAEGRSTEAVYTGLASWDNLPIRFAPPVKPGRVPVPDTASSELDDLLNMVDLPGKDTGSSGGEPVVWKNAIETLLEQNLTAVFDHPDFIRTNAAWNGLDLLATACAGSEKLFLQTLSTTGENLDKLGDTLGRAFSQTVPDLILLDFSFDNTPRSLGIIKAVAAVCETFLVPAIISVNEKFFYLSAWDDVSKLPYLPHYLQETRFAEWKRFTASSDASWLAVTCNPFRIQKNQSDGDRGTAGNDNPFPLLSPVWALGAVCAQSVRICGWPTRFVDDPLCRIQNSTALLHISPEKISDFSKAGLLPLSTDVSNNTVFFQTETTVAGTSFASQMLVSKTVSFFLKLSRQIDKTAPLKDQTAQIQQAWENFLGKTGSQPDQTDVRLTRDDTGQILLAVSFMPPETILHQSSPVKFNLLW